MRKDAGGAARVVHNLFTQAQTFVPASIPRVTAIRLQSGAGATFQQGQLQLPAYATVVLQ